MKNQKTDNYLAVLGVGNALVDIMIALPNDELLAQFNLPRGSMTLVDSQLSATIYEATKAHQQRVTTGGSVANSMFAMACLGGNCGYVGKVGNDELGKLFSDEFHQKNIRTHFSFGELGTGRVMAMVSSDSERTMATYLGAAATLLPGEFAAEMMQGYRYAYVEGYLVQDHALIETICRTAFQSGLSVAIDLSSYNIVAENREFLQQLISKYVDIVFANEEEAFSYTGLEPEEALAAITMQCKLAVVKLGKKGSLIRRGNEVIHVLPVAAQPLDTTGAGDSYAAGFLYGLTKGLPLQQCGDIASLIAAKTVEVMGAKIPENEWPEILKQVGKIETA